ncbi:hypothetical protein Tco_0609025 [Tanacetum coccineum]
MVSTFNETLSLVGFIPLKNSMREKEAVESVFMDIIVGEGSFSQIHHVVVQVALASVDATNEFMDNGFQQGLELEPDGLHLQLLSYKGIIATWLTHTDLELTFIALGGVSITLLSKVYCILSRYYFLLRGITFVVVSETAKRISSKWSDAFLMGDCRSRAHSIPSLFYRRADFSGIRRR